MDWKWVKKQKTSKENFDKEPGELLWKSTRKTSCLEETYKEMTFAQYCIFSNILTWSPKLSLVFLVFWPSSYPTDISQYWALVSGLKLIVSVVWWHNSLAVMGEACHIHESGYCNMSVCAPLPPQRTDCSAKDWTLSNSYWASCLGTLWSHSSYTTQGRMQPPYTLTEIYAHLLIPPSKWTCHSTLNTHRLHVDRLWNQKEDFRSNNSTTTKTENQPTRKATKRHLQ